MIGGRFNGHLKDALIVFVDESFWVGKPSVEAKIKTMITEPFIMVEQKYHDAYKVKNHKSVIIASNAEWVVPANKRERRFSVLEVVDTHVGDFKYFAEIQKEMDNGGREAMLYDLLHLDISCVNLREIPKTRGLMDQIELNLDIIEKFWHEKLRSGVWRVKNMEQGIGHGIKAIGSGTQPAPYSKIDGKNDSENLYEFKWNDCDFVITEDLHEEYVEFSKKHGEPKRATSSVFMKRIKGLCDGISTTRRTLKNGQRVQSLVFPPLDKCRGEFKKRFK
jgi:hypothetical protein